MKNWEISTLSLSLTLTLLLTSHSKIFDFDKKTRFWELYTVWEKIISVVKHDHVQMMWSNDFIKYYKEVRRIHYTHNNINKNDVISIHSCTRSSLQFTNYEFRIFVPCTTSKYINQHSGSRRGIVETLRSNTHRSIIAGTAWESIQAQKKCHYCNWPFVDTS